MKGGILVTGGKNDQEFFASVAADAIVWANGFHHALGDFLEHRIAGQMAVTVIHFFEMIDVAQDDSDRRLLALAARQFASEKFNGGTAAGCSGEKVVRGLKMQSVAGGDQFILSAKDAFRDAQARAEFVDVEWFGEIVVGAGVEAEQQIVFLRVSGEQHEEGVS